MSESTQKDTAEQAEFRQYCRDWLASNTPGDPPVRLPLTALEIMNTEQLAYLKKWQKAAYDAGLVGCDYPLAVEFRHRSWAKTEVYRFLESNKSCLVSVDAPTIPALFPKTSVQTAGFGYIRLHSRNASKWYKSGEDRYDYHYSDQELEEWLPVLDAFSERASNVFVYFNNCHRGQAAENARAMKKIIKQAGLNVSLPEINRSAETVEGGLWRRD